MPGTLRVLNYRQQKAGACDTYSYRVLYGGADDQALPIQRSLLAPPQVFSGLAVVVFCASAASRRKE